MDHSNDTRIERTTQVALKSAQTMGDILGLADVVGHLLLIAPTEYVTEIPTKFTKPGEKPSDAIRVDVAVLTQQDDKGENGVVYRGVLWFNIVRLSLRKSIPDTANGDAVLARVGQGPAQSGQDPPFVLVDAMGDADAVAFAEQWLNAHPEFMAVAQVEAQRAMSEAGKPVAAPAGQPVPGLTTEAVPTRTATAPAVAPIPAANTAAPVSNVALPGMGGQATQGGGAAAIPVAGTAAADLLAALGPEERMQLLAALQK